MHLLIVEDDLDLGGALLAALKGEGFTAVWVRRLAEARHTDLHGLDAVLLDLTLPDGDGNTLLHDWRARAVAVPVIVITARATLEDRLAGLDGGADDFIVKPFAMAELVSRLWAVHRRCAQQASQVWVLGELKLEPAAHRAWLCDAPLGLSPREFRLLLELARRPGALVSKGVLAERLEPLGEPLDAATVEVHMANLRRKIGPQRVRTVRGVGYQLLA